MSDRLRGFLAALIICLSMVLFCTVPSELAKQFYIREIAPFTYPFLMERGTIWLIIGVALPAFVIKVVNMLLGIYAGAFIGILIASRFISERQMLENWRVTKPILLVNMVNRIVKNCYKR